MPIMPDGRFEPASGNGMTPELRKFILYGIPIHDKQMLKRMPKMYGERYIEQHGIYDPDCAEYVMCLAGKDYDPHTKTLDDANKRIFCAALFMTGCSYATLAKLFGIAPPTVLRKVQRVLQLGMVNTDREMRAWNPELAALAYNNFRDMCEANPQIHTQYTTSPIQLGLLLLAHAEEQVALDQYESDPLANQEHVPDDDTEELSPMDQALIQGPSTNH